jgi:hypothetical protein
MMPHPEPLRPAPSPISAAEFFVGESSNSNGHHLAMQQHEICEYDTSIYVLEA